MMKGNPTYYFILYPLIFFLVFSFTYLVSEKEYTSMKDILGILLFYYVLISGYYFMDVVSERMKKDSKDKR